MGLISGAVSKAVSDLLTAPRGTDNQLNAAAQSAGPVPQISLDSIVVGNFAAEFGEKSTPTKYPVVTIFCDKLQNTLKEKFRTFSGTASAVIDLRHSQDRLDDLQTRLEQYVDAACTVLNGARGDWGSGMFYAGGFEVSFGAVKRGGKNFVQSARIAIQVDVSV